MKDGTLFHLVPLNELADSALRVAQNLPFVSESGENGVSGLEIGFHVPGPVSPCGHVIAKLGRDADLILPESYSGVHLAFQMQLETLVVMLSVRTKRVSSVRVALDGGNSDDEEIEGDCALVYGQRYLITIADYLFRLVWRNVDNPDPAEALRVLTIEGYEGAMLRMRESDVRSRNMSLPDTSTPYSYYTTRLQSAKAPIVVEERQSREFIGAGVFGNVFKSLDRRSGHYLAVKIVDLTTQSNTEDTRTRLHREIKILEGLSHPHIIQCLGSRDFHTNQPLIFMPLCEGTLSSLVGKTDTGELRKGTRQLCNTVLKQMLSAIDYLAFRRLCHRDLKPDNILYDLREGVPHFQLADFGLANMINKANTMCGSPLYWAPEAYTADSPHSSKMDIWSLFVTILHIHPDCPSALFPPPGYNSMTWAGITRSVLVAAASFKSQPELCPMAKVNPEDRPSAAQLLLSLYRGEGLTTPKHTIRLFAPADPATLGPLPALSAPQRPRRQGLVQLPNVRTRALVAGRGLLPTRRPFAAEGAAEGQPSFPGAAALRLRPKPAGINRKMAKKPAPPPRQTGFAGQREKERRRNTRARGLGSPPMQTMLLDDVAGEQTPDPEPQTFSPARVFKVPESRESNDKLPPLSRSSQQRGPQQERQGYTPGARAEPSSVLTPGLPGCYPESRVLDINRG